MLMRLTTSIAATEPTIQDVADSALVSAALASNSLTGQSRVVSHGWFTE